MFDTKPCFVVTQPSRRLSLLSLVALLCSHLVFTAASTTTESGILPPPPPPPPPPSSQEVPSESTFSANKQDVLGRGDIAAVSSSDELKDNEVSEQKPIDSSEYNPLTIETIEQGDIPSASETQTWESDGNLRSNDITEQPAQADSQQVWRYQQQQQQQQQPEYQPPSYHGQWSQTYDHESWGSQHPMLQQHPRPYTQSQQLVPFRPQPSPKASASRLFNMAVRKIQTGIDTVSESLDTNKVVSGVSSLTSRLGTLGDAVTSSVGLGGGKPRHMGPSMGQRYPQQRMDRRRVIRQEYAPPMSELYSLGAPDTGPQNQVFDEGDVKTSEETQWSGEGNDLEASTPYPNQEDESDTDDDDSPVNTATDHVSNMFRRPTPSAPKLSDSNAAVQDLTIPQSTRPRPVVRDTDRWQSSQSWSNGSSTTASSASRPRHYRDYDDDESSSIGSKVKSVIGAVPIPNIPRMFKRGLEEYDDGAWSDDESKEKSGFRSISPGAPAQGRLAFSRANTAIVPRPVMSLLEKRKHLLSPAASKRCTTIGRTQAVLNAAQLALVIFAIHEVLPILYDSLSVGNEDLRTTILSAILVATDGWSLHALGAAFLISASNSAWIKPSIKILLSDVAAESESEALYTQLYLRLISSIPMKKSFPSETVCKAAKAEAMNAVSTARLHFFITLAVTYILLSTVAVLKPAGVAVAEAIVRLVKLCAGIERPIAWDAVLDGSKVVGLDLLGSLRALFHAELDEVRQQPLRVVVVVSLLAALCLVSYLPSLERHRKANPSALVDDEDEEEDTITSLWSNIGSSSATRLSLLSSPRGVEGALDQFSRLRPDRAAAAGILMSRPNTKLSRKKTIRKNSPSVLQYMMPLLREGTYLLSSVCLLLVPLLFYSYVWAKIEVENGENSVSLKAIPLEGWSSLLEMLVLLFMTNIQVGKAVHNAIAAANARLGSSLTIFFRTLSGVVEEIQKLAATSSTSDFQAMLTASPTEGIAVHDFWAAHSSRKSWAIKGANVQCRNGEVVLVIGAGGSGKSRLLTSIAEHVFAPPKSARTTTYARGTINVSGVDLSKWDRATLQRRVGVWLHDVRTVSDYASLMTGCTLEEILEPILDSQMSSKAKNAVVLAMKITGLGSKLSKQLPSRLSTVVSANEDELKPSPLRPPSYSLSPSDWSLVLLTKVLAQLIAGNDNQQSTPKRIANCLVGSVLLLDDATSQMGEVDEAQFISALRSTGAAVVLTSKRWATGRFADRIVVINNGSIVESGTHADLMNLGPQRSLYAHQWQRMSSI